tara:strand:- start:9463 stop:9711 length:249 start_codon:yes stop_codon:yes gene_type:complete
MNKDNQILISELKKFVKEQAILTRRTILKNSNKTDISVVKKRLKVLEDRAKKEKLARDLYPAVKEAYNHYKISLRLVEGKNK